MLVEKVEARYTGASRRFVLARIILRSETDLLALDGKPIDDATVARVEAAIRQICPDLVLEDRA